MPAAFTPGRPLDQHASAFDLPIRPLLVAAGAGAPLEPAVLAVVRAFGFASLMYGCCADHEPARSPAMRMWATDPHEWLDVYERNAYADIDPRLTRTADRTAPLLWDGAALGGGGRLRRFLDDAGRYGIRSGVALSFRSPDRRRIVVALSSPVSPVDAGRAARIARRVGDIMLFATRFHDVFMAPSIVPAPVPPRAGVAGDALTLRERQCLQMAAHGLTSADIAAKLGVAARTVNFHFSNILLKLGVLNRHEAIARAITRGTIRIEV
jgi:LuxR family quorum-sensing system transcriptional regulator SolR